MKIFRKLIDPTVSFLGCMLAARKINVDSERTVFVNLGCGLTISPGWINVDASLNALLAGSPVIVCKILYKLSGSNRYYSENEYCSILKNNRFIFHDLARSLPFNKNTIDFFYTSHFIEHLFLEDARRLLKSCYQSLKDGGVIRIAVPDLAYAIQQYHQGKKREMLENYFFVNDLHSYLARHKYMYDFNLLEEELISIGFKKITRCNFREGVVPGLVDLDNRPDETLFVEASK